MGVDWYPCKLEADVDRNLFEVAAELNHRCFLFHQTRPEWYPYINWSAQERDRLQEESKNSAAVDDFLLFKMNSHRVTVIGNCVVFPAEWRIDAFRTIPPWELPQTIEKWKNHFHEVQSGKHRNYLYEWFLYESTLELRNGYLQLIELVNDLENEDAAPKKNEQLAKVCRGIKSLAIPSLLPHPLWPDWESKADQLPRFQTDPRYLNLSSQYETLEEYNAQWNQYVRVRKRMQPLSGFTQFDWVKYEEAMVSIHWPIEFFEWVEPCLSKGFGLYRDC